jgi:hypothetical protein
MTHTGKPQISDFKFEISNFKSQIFAAAIAALLVLIPARSVFPGCACADDRIEIVFVVDTTSSMKDALATVKEQALKLLMVISRNAGDVRVGMVEFRTPAGPDFDIKVYPFTADLPKFVEVFRQLAWKGGGEENGDQALSAAVDGMSWTKGARKIIVILSDEGPPPDHEAILVAAAQRARERGIVVNAVTPSRSAWQLFGGLQIKATDPAAYQRLTGGRTDEEMLQTFTLPIYDRAAEITGGKSAGMAGARDMAAAILTFALGQKVAQAIDARKLIDAKEDDFRPPAAGPSSGTLAITDGRSPRPLMGRLRFDGDWDRPFSPQALADHLKDAMHVDYSRGAAVLGGTEDLKDAPILFLSGESAIDGLDEPARKNIRGYLDRGGLLLASACCGSEAFDKSFREWVKKLYPEAALEKLPLDHALFKAGYEIKEIRYTAAHRVAEYKAGPPEVWGVSVKGRLKAVYVPQSLGHTWRTRPFEPPCLMHDEDGRKLTVNIVLYAMQ